MNELTNIIDNQSAYIYKLRLELEEINKKSVSRKKYDELEKELQLTKAYVKELEKHNARNAGRKVIGKDAEIMDLRKQGLTIPDVAAKVGVSIATVNRTIKRQRVK